MLLILQSSRIYQQNRTSLSIVRCTKCHDGTPAQLLIVNFITNFVSISKQAMKVLMIAWIFSTLRQWEWSPNYQSQVTSNDSCIDQWKGCSNFPDFTAIQTYDHCHQTSFRPAQPYQCEKYFSIIIFISLEFKHDHFGSFKSNIMYMLVE